MGFDLVLRFLESRLELTLFSNLIYGLLLLILIYIYFFIAKQFEGIRLKIKGARIFVLSIILFLFLIAFIIYSGDPISQISWKDESLNKKQKEFYNKQIEATSPITPKINFKLDFPEYKEIAVWQIANVKEGDDKNLDFDRYKIRFILNNIGQEDSGSINTRLESSFTNIAQEFLTNIPSGKSEFAVFSVWYKKCFSYPEEYTLENGTIFQRFIVNKDCDYKVSKIPLGWQEFNLTIDCKFCMETEQTYPISFCIFDETQESRKVCEEK